MANPAASLRSRLFGIDRQEVTFAKRGFWAGEAAAVARLEQVGGSFVDGYHVGLRCPEAARLGEALEEVEPELRGFAFEGAGMALALLDRVTPWSRDRLARFLDGPGEPHVYMVTIGAGWAWARLGAFLAPVTRERERLDPILGWLALDGYGFHEGYFRPQRTVVQRLRPRSIRGEAGAVFDAGVGRSLWFGCGANPTRIAESIASFPAERRPDLWAGTGLACAYAGGASEAGVAQLCALACGHRGALAQGAAFAAKARDRAGNPAAQTSDTVSRICAAPAELAVKLCDTELASALAECEGPGTAVFADWRRRIRESYERGFGTESP